MVGGGGNVRERVYLYLGALRCIPEGPHPTSSPKSARGVEWLYPEGGLYLDGSSVSKLQLPGGTPMRLVSV